MVWIPGGSTVMGSDQPDSWADERPPHQIVISGFWMDETEVTNDQFRAFVEATGYVTTAERPVRLDGIERDGGTIAQPPGQHSDERAEEIAENLLAPGSIVFVAPDAPVSNEDLGQWWKWVPGANWRHPEGPGSDINDRGDHPVVHVSWYDAVAYAQWAGKQLPTEAQREYAARGGLLNNRYVWGDRHPAEDLHPANIWQGEFPHRNTARDGYAATAPVRSFPPNQFGLYDMAGNVWEWCSDWYDRGLYQRRAARAPIVDPQGPEKSFDPLRPDEQLRVMRGGSFLCHESYCNRYRPSARFASSPETSTSHTGFRCVKPPIE